MKKTLFIAGAMLLSIFFAGSAFAITCTNGYADISTGYELSATFKDPGFTLKGSKNVCGFYTSDTAPPEGETYEICTSHISGDKSFGSTSTRQVILSTGGKNSKCSDGDFNSGAWTSL